MKYTELKITKPALARVAFVTGGTGTLGSAVARLLSERGWKVIFQYLNNSGKANALCEEISKKSSFIRSVNFDLTKRKEEVSRLISGIEEEFGTIDLFIHCSASPIEAGGISDEGYINFQRMSDLHIHSFLKVTESILPGMKYRQRGTIIGVLSEALLEYGNPVWASYAATKMALASFLMNLASDIEPFGLRAIGVMPGAFKVDGVSRVPTEIREAVRKQWPTGVAPEEVAKMVVSVLDDPSKFPNRTFLAINDQDGVRDVSRFGFFLKESFREDSAEVAVEEKKQDSVKIELEKTFRKVFKLKENEDVEEAKFGVWSAWDSLGHLTLIVAVEENLNVAFLDTEIGKLTSFQKVLQAVRQARQSGRTKKYAI